MLSVLDKLDLYCIYTVWLSHCGLWQVCDREIVVYSLDEVMLDSEQAAGKFWLFLSVSVITHQCNFQMWFPHVAVWICENLVFCAVI